MSVLSRLGVAASILDQEVKRFFRGLLLVNTVTAAGSTSTDATLLSAGKNVVLAADGTKGTILPPAELYMEVVVLNTVSNQDLKVYPAVGEQINALTVTTGAFTVVAKAEKIFRCDALLHWYVAAGNLTGTSTSASTAELDVLDAATAANATTGKAAILGTNGAVTFGGAVTAVGSFIIGSADMSEADLEKLDGITNGTQAASKAVVNDSNVNQGIAKVTELHIGASGTETQVTATGGELNTLAAASAVLATEAGAGITGGVGTVYKSAVQRLGGIIKSSILIDLTGLSSSTTDLDIIGSGAASSLGRITAARSGTILSGRMTCLEAPVGGVTDIDLYSASVSTGAFDDLVTDLTEVAIVTAGGAWTIGLEKAITGIPPANDYLYLCGGAGGTAAPYTAGKFLIDFDGYDA